MKSLGLFAAMVIGLHLAASAATVDLQGGPQVAVAYDPDLWQVFSRIPNDGSRPIRSTTWELKGQGTQVTVASRPEKRTIAEFKRELVERQKFRGDPAVLVRERRESFGGRDWFVLEFHNPHTRPPRTERTYYSAGEDGHVTVFVIGSEAVLPNQQKTIDALLAGIKVK
jgi:hypothetical protein